MRTNDYLHRTGSRAISETHFRNHPSVEEKLYYILVEGCSDEKFWRGIINNQVCKIIPMADDKKKNIDGAKQKVINEIKKFNTNKSKFYLGIVDSDFDNIIKKNKVTIENLVYVDTHDIEVLMYNNVKDIRRFLSEYTDFNLLVQKEKAWNRKFLDKVFDAAYVLGVIKYGNVYRKTGKGLNDIPINDIIDSDFNVNIDEVLKRMHTNSQVSHYKSIYIDDLSMNYDRLQICNGHDISEILRCAFLPNDENGLGYGNKNNKRLEAFHIESRLRAIYEKSKLDMTEVYKNICKWQNIRKINIFAEQVESSVA